MAARSLSIEHVYLCHSSTKPEGGFLRQGTLPCVKKTPRKARKTVQPGTDAVGVPSLTFARSPAHRRPVSPMVLSLAHGACQHDTCRSRASCLPVPSLCPTKVLRGVQLVVIHRTADIDRFPGPALARNQIPTRQRCSGCHRRMAPALPATLPRWRL
jgi:hypothetical protein